MKLVENLFQLTEIKKKKLPNIERSRKGSHNSLKLQLLIHVFSVDCNGVNFLVPFVSVPQRFRMLKPACKTRKKNIKKLQKE